MTEDQMRYRIGVLEAQVKILVQALNRTNSKLGFANVSLPKRAK